PAQRAAAADRLSAAVFSSQVGELWRSAAELAAAGHRLRVRLDIRPDRLRALPWELLRWDGQGSFPRKHLSAWRGPEPQRAGDDERGPVRVLLVVCNPLDNRVKADEELAMI